MKEKVKKRVHLAIQLVLHILHLTNKSCSGDIYKSGLIYPIFYWCVI